MHVGKNDLNDVYVLTQRQIPIDQIVQETTEIPPLQHIDNMVNISVAGIMQVSRVRVVTKTDEIPQSQYIDGFINDSGVRAPQVLIVVKTVVNSQCNETCVCDISISSFQLACSSSRLCDRFHTD